MSILGRQSKWRRILMMDLVNIFIQRPPMQRPMHPVVKGIFHNEETTDLPGHCLPIWKGYVEAEAKVRDDGVEEVDLGQFNGEVLEEDVFCAGPLFGGRGDLGLKQGLVPGP
jgi:hypothetical protein